MPEKDNMYFEIQFKVQLLEQADKLEPRLIMSSFVKKLMNITGRIKMILFCAIS